MAHPMENNILDTARAIVREQGLCPTPERVNIVLARWVAYCTYAASPGYARLQPDHDVDLKLDDKEPVQ